MKSFNIQIPSIIDNIRIVESFIENAKDKYNINDDIYGNIMIAVTESVSNAIRHGNQNEKTKNVQLSIYEIDNQLHFEIKDEGEGFNFMDLPDPTSPENLEKPGGRGIFLISNLCDKYFFEEKGTTIKLIFNV